MYVKLEWTNDFCSKHLDKSSDSEVCVRLLREKWSFDSKAKCVSNDQTRKYLC